MVERLKRSQVKLAAMENVEAGERAGLLAGGTSAAKAPERRPRLPCIVYTLTLCCIGLSAVVIGIELFTTHSSSTSLAHAVYRHDAKHGMSGPPKPEPEPEPVLEDENKHETETETEPELEPEPDDVNESFVETMDGPLACTCADTTCSRLISRQEPDNFDPVLSRTSFGKMVRMSEDTFAVLKQNRVQFVPNGGTFIGAVRSGGSIPWDDDVDIYFEHISDRNVTTGMPQSIDNTAALQTAFAQLRAKGWEVLDGLNKEGVFSVCDGRGRNSSVCLAGISWCRSNNTVTYRCALSTTYKQDVERVFPLVWSKWHSSEISVPKNPMWFWQDVAMRDQREGNMTATDQWDTAMNNAAIRDRGHHLVKWKRRAEKRQISKIPFLSGYDPALWERTLPWRCTRRGDLSNKTVQVR